MSRYNNRKTLSGRDIAIRLLIAVVCWPLSVIFLPHGDNQLYEVPVDQPWQRRELVAPFDFPLLKSEEVLQRERDSVRRNVSPYFVRDDKVTHRMLDSWTFAANQMRSTGNVSPQLLDYVTTRLQEVYKTGVVETAIFDSIVTINSIQSLSIVTGNTSQMSYIDQVYIPSTAYKHLVTKSDTLHYSKAALQQLNLAAYIQPNLKYDAHRTHIDVRERLDEILAHSGRVLKGTRIVDRGEVVTEAIAQKIRSLNEEMKMRDIGLNESLIVLLGQGIYAAVIMIALGMYLVTFRFDYIVSMRHVCLIAMLMSVMPLINSILVRFSIYNTYVIPFAMIPIMARIFTDSRTAAMVMLASLVLCALPLNQPFDFVLIQLLAGIVGIYSLRDLSERSQLIRCAFNVTVAALMARFSLDLIREGSLQSIGWLYYISLIVSGVLLLFAYPLLFMIERVFGFTSNVTLVELSNINNPLMRRLSEEAPGTFQHVMQVANLAAEVANAIGGKSQLVRTGALYHDIGKLKDPVYFTENQRGVNLHDRLTPQQSARIIISHVEYGAELADKHNLPRVIRDFIKTHHGAGKATYFYLREKENHPDEEVDVRLFTYPGPNPTTVEQAILMMADAVEAASRSLDKHTDETISTLVDKIVDGQLAAGYFKNCPITFRDIATAKQVFCDKLRTIYHTRLKYPDDKNPAEKNGSEPGTAKP